MILEFLVSSALQEWVMRKFKIKRKNKNDIEEIKKLKCANINDVHSVGELRAILDNFADDVPLGTRFEWYHVQVLEINGVGSLHIGQVHTWGK